MSSMMGLQRLMTPFKARIHRMIAGAIIKAVKDDTDLQTMMIKTIGSAVYDNVEVFGNYGVTCNPPLDLDAVAIERNGKYIVIAVGDRKYRIKNLQSGDVCVYDMRGQTAIFTDNGIEMKDKNNNVITMAADGITINKCVIKQDGTVTTPQTVTTGGDITSGGDVISSTGKTLDTHTHKIASTEGCVAAALGSPSVSATTTAPVA